MNLDWKILRTQTDWIISFSACQESYGTSTASQP